ncbi:MAG TPA: hypothetical protein VNK26_06410, partial [Pyrinomonadaceae bacterium]|nr:hypothetical protein [Pyrinomonadaceae bacterium]
MNKSAKAFPSLPDSICAALDLLKARFEATCLIFLYLFVSIWFTTAAQAQIKTFRWQSDLCSFEGRYDSRKYTKKQLLDTWTLISGENLQIDDTKATVWKWDEIALLNVQELDRQYNELLDKIKSLDYIKTPYTEALYKNRLRELEEVYRLARTTMLGYKAPKELLKYPGADQCKLDYAEPIIAGGEKLQKAWERVNIDSRAKNADPERLRLTFEAQRS